MHHCGHWLRAKDDDHRQTVTQRGMPFRRPKAAVITNAWIALLLVDQIHSDQGLADQLFAPICEFLFESSAFIREGHIRVANLE